MIVRRWSRGDGSDGGGERNRGDDDGGGGGRDGGDSSCRDDGGRDSTIKPRKNAFQGTGQIDTS